MCIRDRSKGVEVVLNSKNIRSKNLQWTTSFNIANNTNEIKSLPNGNADIITGETINRVGESVASFFLPEFAGADPATGCLLYTSDAADERSSVDLGGRRIIKIKKRRENTR